MTARSSVRTSQLSPRALRILTPAQCIAEAEALEDRAECWSDEDERESDLHDARGWRRLAEERS